MQSFKIKPVIIQFDTMQEFYEQFPLGKGDLLLVSNSIYKNYFAKYEGDMKIINCGRYGKGEPTDQMVEAILRDLAGVSYDRVIAVGGGAILDVAKLFSLENIEPLMDLYDKKLRICKSKRLILIPTTCGTGSEVTNISVLEFKQRNTKIGLATDELYADYAILIPELLEKLPFNYFATSSIDALIHAIESFTSPKANEFTRIFAKKAMEIILSSYKKIVEEGQEARKGLLKEFLIASTYAGISFGNAGCAAVHAMSFPFGGAYHVPHGEAIYVLFNGVYRKYMELKPEGAIEELNTILQQVLECRYEEVYEVLGSLLNNILPKKSLREYGVLEEELMEFAESVIKRQQRLMVNSYVTLNQEDVYEIYRSLY